MYFFKRYLEENRMKHSRKMTPIHIYVASTFFFSFLFFMDSHFPSIPMFGGSTTIMYGFLYFVGMTGESRPMLCIIPVYKYSTVDIWSDYYLSTCMVCSEVYSICSCSRREYPVSSRDHLLCNL